MVCSLVAVAFTVAGLSSLRGPAELGGSDSSAGLTEGRAFTLPKAPRFQPMRRWGSLPAQPVVHGDTAPVAKRVSSTQSPKPAPVGKKVVKKSVPEYDSKVTDIG